MPPSPTFLPPPHLPRHLPSLHPHHTPPICQTPPPSPPTTIAAAITLATTSLSLALSSGLTRLRINTLIPALNPLVEDSYPYSAQTLQLVAHSLVTQTPQLAAQDDALLLFPSAGGAATAAYNYAQNPETKNDNANIRVSSFATRDEIDGGASRDLNLLVAPICRRGDDVMDQLEAALAQAPHATWLLFNPSLYTDRAAVGMGEITRRNEFEACFPHAFYFRGLYQVRRPTMVAVEKGALMFSFPGPWTLYALLGGEYQLVLEQHEMPNVDQITTVLKRAAFLWRKRTK